MEFHQGQKIFGVNLLKNFEMCFRWNRINKCKGKNGDRFSVEFVEKKTYANNSAFPSDVVTKSPLVRKLDNTVSEKFSMIFLDANNRINHWDMKELWL